jgi:hypothetical protein
VGDGHAGHARRAPRLGRRVALGPGAPKAQALALTVRGDTARLDYFGDPMLLRVDARGAILSVDGARTTNKVRVQRVAAVDVAAMARDFAARPAMGAASPTDSLKAAVGRRAGWPSCTAGRACAASSVWGGTLVPTASSGAPAPTPPPPSAPRPTS